MNWKSFRLINNILGWVTFAVAAVTYLLTMGSSSALWDCPEFTLSAYNLEVGHPPGAPFYMLVYNVLTHLTSDPMLVARYANAVSGLLSAGTILLLFWTIVHMARRIVLPEYRPYSPNLTPNAQKLSPLQALLIWGSGLVGALAYTFSDTFWYSAVESEVYSFSSFFTALVFWLIFQWEDRSQSPYSHRWLLLIAYFMGLSIGVHLLNLLCLPAIALVMYFRQSKRVTLKGALLTLVVSALLILIMMFGIIQGTMRVGTALDIFAVNTLGWGVNSGFYIYLIALVGVLCWSARALASGKNRTHALVAFAAGVVLSGIPFMTGSWFVNLLILIALLAVIFGYKKLSLQLLKTVQMAVVVVLIGFSSYGVILVRALADTPMNQNNPSNAVALQKYLNRSQYGQTPLLSGPTFASPAVSVDYPSQEWTLQEVTDASGRTQLRYVANPLPQLKYAPGTTTLFPRMYSPQESHIQGYNSWIGRDPSDRSLPTFADNLRFFFAYQVNFMYWRYFGWNFIGRQNDLQGDGSMLKGNVVSGLDFLDKHFVGPQKNMPASTAQNKAHNVYFMIPLLLGLLGIFFQLSGKKPGVESFWVAFWLFFMTGIAIIFYLNQTPGQPRERDYAYAGSFYAFSIWIGLGVAGIYTLLQRIKLPNRPALAAALLLGLIAPTLMATQNWDDHDRSGRRLASDFGYNYLMSCTEPNAVLFCYGDNDTFPLWYVQSLEKVRPDIKICNLSYLQSDWYSTQMLQPSLKSDAVPHRAVTPHLLVNTPYVSLSPGDSMPLKEALDRIAQSPDKPLPARQLFLDVPQEALAQYTAPATQTMPSEEMQTDSATQAPPAVAPQAPGESVRMEIRLDGMSGLARDQYMVLDMIEAAGFKRPLYWVATMPTSTFSNLPAHLSQEGMAKRLTPYASADGATAFDVERTYNLVMNTFRYFNANDPDIYFDENIRRNIAYYYRFGLFSELAKHLIEAGDTARAKDVLAKCKEVISTKAVPYQLLDLYLADNYYLVGMNQEADEIVLTLARQAINSVHWWQGMSASMQERALLEGVIDDAMQQLYFAQDTALRNNSNVLEPLQQEISSLMLAFTAPR